METSTIDCNQLESVISFLAIYTVMVNEVLIGNRWIKYAR